MVSRIDDIDARFGIDGEVGTAGHFPALRARQLFGFAESFGISGRQHQQGVGRGGPHLPKCPQYLGFFALHRAAGDDHRARRGHAEIAQHAIARPRLHPTAHRPRGGGPGLERRRRQLQRIELQAAGDHHPGGIRAQVDETPRRLFTLHQEAIDVIHHAAHHRADHPVAREGPR